MVGSGLLVMGKKGGGWGGGWEGELRLANDSILHLREHPLPHSPQNESSLSHLQPDPHHIRRPVA